MNAQAMNPYLPCYEYIPDGEPRVFGDRLYIFGSHDKFGGRQFCENDYVTWSAPVEDLSQWRYEGVIYGKEQDPRPGNLYAPDVVQGPDGRYYLYYSKANSTVIGVAVCDTPAGQYRYLGEVVYADGTVLGEKPGDYYQFDPSVLVDEGRVWLYSGSGQYSSQKQFRQKMVGCMVMELELDMRTVKSRPKVLLPGSKKFLTKTFFEGASARKINGTYYLVFPTNDMTGLNYATASRPDGDFTIRGVLHSSSDVGLGKYTLQNPAYPLGNSHGGLVCLKGQWYIFDHRMTNNSLFSRQGVAEPVEIQADGSIRQAESTSSGLNNGPLRGEGTYPAYIACNLLRGFLRYPYITQDKPDGDTTARQYVTGIRRGCRVGYKYFDFAAAPLTLTIEYRSKGQGKLHVLTEDGGTPVGTVKIQKAHAWSQTVCTLHVPLGKSALFFHYQGSGSMELRTFTFSKQTQQ